MDGQELPAKQRAALVEKVAQAQQLADELGRALYGLVDGAPARC